MFNIFRQNNRIYVLNYIIYLNYFENDILNIFCVFDVYGCMGKVIISFCIDQKYNDVLNIVQNDVFNI